MCVSKTWFSSLSLIIYDECQKRIKVSLLSNITWIWELPENVEQFLSSRVLTLDCLNINYSRILVEITYA